MAERSKPDWPWVKGPLIESMIIQLLALWEAKTAFYKIHGPLQSFISQVLKAICISVSGICLNKTDLSG